jgi:antitoxin component YwqK of YwqJK toxin-antitoxin module
VQNGRRTFWYSNGQKRSEGEFARGVPTGVHREWYPNGQPKSEGSYLEGRPVGAWSYWLPDGTIDERMKSAGSARRSRR